MLQVFGLFGVAVGVGLGEADALLEGLGVGTGVALGVAAVAGCMRLTTRVAEIAVANALPPRCFIESKIDAKAQFAGQDEALHSELKETALLARQSFRQLPLRREPQITLLVLPTWRSSRQLARWHLRAPKMNALARPRLRLK